MRYPKFLAHGDTIGYIAPSFGCNIEPYLSAFKNAEKKFKRMGYKQVFGPNCYAGEGIGISNTPEKCGQEVMDMFLSGEADCVISCGGGELMCEILPFVDFEKLAAAEPKWFMGYSDNTNLTYLLATLADTASIYGPCAPAFGMKPWHESLYDAFGILTGERKSKEKSGKSIPADMENEKSVSARAEDEKRVPDKVRKGRKGAGRAGEGGSVPCGGKSRTDSFEWSICGYDAVVEGYHLWEKESLKNAENPLAPYHVTEHRRIRSYMGKRQTSKALRFQGRLLGGCMDCLVNLLGTRFDRTAEFIERYREDGIIWFLEACDLNVFGIRRAMWQMEEAGWFRHVKGFLIGRPLNGEPVMNLDTYSAVLEVAGCKNVPVIMDVDIGHLPPMMPLVTGSVAEVFAKGNDIQIGMRYI